LSSPKLTSGMTTFMGVRAPVQAYLTRPSTSEPRPAVVVIHEVHGLTDHTKDIADRLAREGYVALAPALFSSDPELASLFTPQNVNIAMGVMMKIPAEKRGDPAYVQQLLAKEPPTTRDVAQRVMGKMFGGMPKDALTMEAVKAVDFLNSQGFTRRGSVGVVGFCFGGGISINVACHTKTDACVVFYGENPSPIELVEKIQGPVLGIYGAEDARINATLDQLVAAMVRYKKDFQMKIYAGAGHAFFNDTNKMTYREGAAKEAWTQTLGFFSQSLNHS
jgi:carboxymethylenebutenolidase